ncbi:hypothetical protein IV102_34660 [bacterium]|nr:hypothetical protein [bacterium]
MENTKIYAFTRENRVGRACSPLRTPLLEGQTPQGEAVVWVCQPDSFVPVEKASALVKRADVKSPWQTFSTIQGLREWLTGVDPERLGLRLGIWVDRHRWGLFGAADGKIQDKEIETFATRWHGLRTDEMTQFEDRGYRTGDPDHPPQRCILGWWHELGAVDPARVTLREAAFPDKVVAVLEESRRVVHHEVVWAMRLEADKGRSALVPVVTEHRTHNLEGSSSDAQVKREECLQRCQREARPIYVLPDL